MINMAEMVVRRMEKSYVAAHRAEQHHLARALDAHSRPILFVDTGVDPWIILYCNSAAAAVWMRALVEVLGLAAVRQEVSRCLSEYLRHLTQSTHRKPRPPSPDGGGNDHATKFRLVYAI